MDAARRLPSAPSSLHEPVAPVSQASELGLTGQSIVCFSKDWTEDPTSNNHVLGLLAQNNRVLWLNSISTRTPKLSSGRDLAKIRRKLAAALRGARQVRPNLWVATPLVLPLPHNPVATRLNRWILRATVGLLRRRLGMREFQLWSFLPSAAEYFGTLGESLSVYYCTDEWSLFTGMDRERMAAADREICRRADVVFATATSLLEKREPLNREAHLATHGVDHALFSQALLDETQVPEEIASLPKPVLGFYGLLEDWVDQELLAHLAQAHPEWSLVLVGKECVDFSLLKALPNVHLLGRKPHSELPAYCKGFSVGLIPYLLTDRIRTVNPIKLREYLCAGLPVVSTPLPEVLPYGHLCSVAGDKETFLRAVEGALASDTPALHRQRSEAMRAETWERKVRELGTTVARVRHRKQDERLA